MIRKLTALALLITVLGCATSAETDTEVSISKTTPLPPDQDISVSPDPDPGPTSLAEIKETLHSRNPSKLSAALTNPDAPRTKQQETAILERKPCQTSKLPDPHSVLKGGTEETGFRAEAGTNLAAALGEIERLKSENKQLRKEITHAGKHSMVDIRIMEAEVLDDQVHSRRREALLPTSGSASRLLQGRKQKTRFQEPDELGEVPQEEAMVLQKAEADYPAEYATSAFQNGFAVGRNMSSSHAQEDSISSRKRRRHRRNLGCNRAKCNDPNCDAETMLNCPTLHKSVWWGNGDGAMNARFGYKEQQKEIDCTFQRFLDAKGPAQAVVPIVGHSMWAPQVSADSKGLNVKVAHTTCTAFDNGYLLEAKAICNPSYGSFYTLKDRPAYVCSRAGVIAPLGQYKLPNQCCETKDWNRIDGSCRRPSNMKSMHHTHCRNALVIVKYNLCVTQTGNDGQLIKECFEYKYAKCYQCSNYIKYIEGGQGFVSRSGRVDFVRNCKDPKPCGTGMSKAEEKILMQNAADQVAGF